MQLTQERAFQVTRRPGDTRLRPAHVVDATLVSPSVRRITLSGADLVGFDSSGCDDHVGVVFPDSNGVLEPASRGRAGAAGHRGRERAFTPVSWGSRRGTLTLDFVLHGRGVASRWARSAALGDLVGVRAAAESVVVEGTPDWWLLAGDLSALPAIRRYLDRVLPGTPVLAIVTVDDLADRQELHSDGDLVVRWVPTARRGNPDRLLDLLSCVMPQPGHGFAFVAAEDSVVQPARELLADRLLMDPDSFVVRGNWRRGGSAFQPARHTA